MLQSTLIANEIKEHDDDDDDEDAGVETIKFGQIEKSNTQSEITALEIAIIGYWKIN